MIGLDQAGLDEVAALARANISAAPLVQAHMDNSSYILTFRAPLERREQVFAEMDVALNAHRIDTTDATSIRLDFE